MASTMAVRHLRPKIPTGRIVGIDMARTLALVGMMGTHLYRPLYDGEASLAHQLAAGRASALFAVLAGVSLAIITGGSRPVGGAELRARSVGIFVRSVLLYAIGVGLTHVGTPVAVVLQTYAVAMVLMIPFLGWRPRNLAILAGAWVVAGPLLTVWVSTWWPTWTVTGWGTATDHLLGIYPLLVWLTYFWAGLAIGRCDLRKTSTALWLIGVGATSAVAAVVISDRLVMRTPVLRALAEDLGSTDLGYLHMRLNWGLDGFIPGGSNWWLAISSPHSGTPFDLATTLASALAVIGVCLVAARALPRSVALLSGAGAMSLTTYSLHATALSKWAWPPVETRSFWIHLAFFGGVGAVFRLAGLKGPLEWIVSLISTRATAAARRFTPPN